ncbi:MAG TPA: hypothetical protein VE863_09395, partial [Pyrinomonadaceae bacterium]|nr:hypothetical protein [Pyrinomonadaceae bacterium]
FQDRYDLVLAVFAPLHSGLLGRSSYPETSAFQWSVFSGYLQCSVNPSWNCELTDKEWIRDESQLPDFQTLIVSTNPTVGTDWLNLESYFHVDNSPEEDDAGPRYPFRRVNYWLQSFLVKKDDSDDVFRWMNGNWKLSQTHVLPESSGTNDVFLGEFFWSPSFAYHNNPYYYRSGWTRGGPDNEIPKPILLTSDQYFQDRSYDCSIVEPITIRLPHKIIADDMKLNWKGIEGRYYDGNDELLACDPSVDSVGPSALLVNRELFSKYLDDEKYDVIWVLTGEKLIITGGAAGRDWPGRMNLLGVCRLRDGSIDGKIVTKVED